MEQKINNAQQPELNDLKKEDVLQVLDWEINRATVESTQPGWTTWAIYGALAAVIWTLLDQLTSSVLSMKKILLFFLMSQLSLDLLKQLPTIIAPYRKRKSQRFIFSNMLASNRYQMVVETARAVVLISLAKTFAATVLAIFSNFIYFYYGFVAITSIIALVASYLKWPIPIPSADNPAIRIIPALAALLLLALCM